MEELVSGREDEDCFEQVSPVQKEMNSLEIVQYVKYRWIGYPDKIHGQYGG